MEAAVLAGLDGDISKRWGFVAATVAGGAADAACAGESNAAKAIKTETNAAQEYRAASLLRIQMWMATGDRFAYPWSSMAFIERSEFAQHSSIALTLNR
jgi:hypothetical protein